MRKLSCAILFVVILLAGCNPYGVKPANDPTLVPPMQKLTRAVDSYVRYDKPDAAMTSDQILLKATEHDKGLLTPFGKMSLEVLREGDNVVVLLCDSYKDVALMEDSGCTAKVDKNYMGNSTPPCVFTLTPAELCN
ncbi:MAG: hypothetical protein ACK5JO_15960 [Halodesulfovibrio sp.]